MMPGLSHSAPFAHSPTGSVLALAARVFPVGLLLALLFCTPRPALASEGACTLPYGGLVEREGVQRIARSAAWLEALRQAVAEMAHTAAQWGAEQPLRKQALAAAVHRPAVSISPTWAPPRPAGDVTVAVYLTTPPRTFDSRLREALAAPDMLDMREYVLAQVRDAVDEGIRLTRTAADARAWHGLSADRVYNQRIEWLGNRLEALWLFDEALTRLHGVWREPALTAATLRRALTLDEQNPLLWCALGEVQLQQDVPHAALESLNKALSLAPHLPRARYALGIGHLRLQQPALAETDFDAALRHRPDNAAWLRARGAVRMVLEKYELMCQDFLQACALGDCEGLAAARKRSLCLPEKP